MNLLAKEGHKTKTKTEVRLPEGFRVDILAEKDGVIRAIEVKKESRRSKIEDNGEYLPILVEKQNTE